MFKHSSESSFFEEGVYLCDNLLLLRGFEYYDVHNFSLTNGDKSVRCNSDVIHALIPDLPGWDTGFGMIAVDTKSLEILGQIFSGESVVLTRELACKLEKALKEDVCEVAERCREFIDRCDAYERVIETFRDEISEFNILQESLYDIDEDRVAQAVETLAPYFETNRSLVAAVMASVVTQRPENTEVLAHVWSIVCKKISLDELVATSCHFLYHWLKRSAKDEHWFDIMGDATSNGLFWFAPEFEKHNSRRFYSRLKDYQLEKDTSPVVKDLLDNLDDYYADSWKRLLFERELGELNHPIANALRKDDVAYLTEVASRPDFDIDQILKQGYFDRRADGPLHLIEYAAAHKATACVKYLLAIGSPDYDAAVYAVKYGALEIIRIFEETLDEVLLNMCLRAAAETNRMEIFEWLMLKADEMKIIPESVMETAILSNSLQIIEHEMMRGMSLGDTMQCIKRGRGLVPKIALELCSLDAPIPILYQVIRMHSLSLFEFVFSKIRAKLSHEPYSTTLFTLAVDESAYEICKFIIDQCEFVDVNREVSDAKTPLIMAIENNCIPIIEILLEHKDINVNYTLSDDGLTPLMHAVRRGSPKIVELLIHRQDVDLEATVDGKTAAKMAMQMGSFKISSMINKQITARKAARSV